MIRRLSLSLLVMIGLIMPSKGQESPVFLEMLAAYPGQEAVYTSIIDSTGVNFQEGVYIYNRYFKSEAIVLRKGGGGVASAATPIVSDKDRIITSCELGMSILNIRNMIKIEIPIKKPVILGD